MAQKVMKLFYIQPRYPTGKAGGAQSHAQIWSSGCVGCHFLL